MSAGSPYGIGTVANPKRSTVGTASAATANSTSSPACTAARARGMVGWMCPSPAAEVKRTRMRVRRRFAGA